LKFTFSFPKIHRWIWEQKDSLFHLCDVVSLLDGSVQGADSCHQLETLGVESFPQLAQQQGKIFLKAPADLERESTCAPGKTNKIKHIGRRTFSLAVTG